MNELHNQIQKLESQLTGNMFTDMEIKDKIHNLKMKINGSEIILNMMVFQIGKKMNSLILLNLIQLFKQDLEMLLMMM